MSVQPVNPGDLITAETMNALLKEVGGLQSDLVEIKSVNQIGAIKDLQGKAQNLETRIVAVEGAIDEEAPQKIAELQTLVEKINTKVETLDAKVIALDAKVTALDTKATALDTKVIAFDAKIEGFGGKLAAFDARIVALEKASAQPAIQVGLDTAEILWESITPNRLLQPGIPRVDMDVIIGFSLRSRTGLTGIFTIHASVLEWPASIEVLDPDKKPIEGRAIQLDGKKFFYVKFRVPVDKARITVQVDAVYKGIIVDRFTRTLLPSISEIFPITFTPVRFDALKLIEGESQDPRPFKFDRIARRIEMKSGHLGRMQMLVNYRGPSQSASQILSFSVSGGLEGGLEIDEQGRITDTSESVTMNADNPEASFWIYFHAVFGSVRSVVFMAKSFLLEASISFEVIAT